jgi:hypothetical protein
MAASLPLGFIPPWQDTITLAQHLSIPPEMVQSLVARHVLPDPVFIDGEPRWRWADVQKLTSGRVYFIDGGDNIKIGFTRSIRQRLKSLQAASPVPLKVICVVKGGKLREAAFHETFAHLRVHGEWFRSTRELREYIEVLKTRRSETVDHN